MLCNIAIAPTPGKPPMHLAQPAVSAAPPGPAAARRGGLRRRRRAAVPAPPAGDVRRPADGEVPARPARRPRPAVAGAGVAWSSPWPGRAGRTCGPGSTRRASPSCCCVDVSGSMGERDFDAGGELDHPPRGGQAGLPPLRGGVRRRATRPRFEGRPADLLGLVAFATRPEATCPLTLEHATLLRLLDAAGAAHLPGESETNLSDAIALGLARLRAAGNRRQRPRPADRRRTQPDDDRAPAGRPGRRPRSPPGWACRSTPSTRASAPAGDEATAEAVATREAGGPHARGHRLDHRRPLLRRRRHARPDRRLSADRPPRAGFHRELPVQAVS